MRPIRGLGRCFTSLVQRCPTQRLATGFHRFLARFSVTILTIETTSLKRSFSNIYSRRPSFENPQPKKDMGKGLYDLCFQQDGATAHTASAALDLEQFFDDHVISTGRRRLHLYHHKYPPPWSFTLIVLISSVVSIVDACSSRTTPKPRPPPPTPRPNITFHTYECPPEYAAWYCLNGATCFTVKIGDSLLYNCVCSESYMGPRCEYKDLDGSYLPSQRRFMLETASIAGGVTIAVFSVVILCVVVYLHYKRRSKSALAGTDCVDGHRQPSNTHTPIFGTRARNKPLADLPLVQDRGDMKQNSKVELHQVTTLLPPFDDQ